MSKNPDIDPQNDLSEPHRLTQGELIDVVQGLSHNKDKAEFLGSRLQQLNLLSLGVKVSFYRNRLKYFVPYRV